jgi:predicted dehydrogenase
MEDQFVGTGKTRLVSVGFMRRFDPGYTHMKASIEAREHGAPLLLHCTSRGMSAPVSMTSEMSIKGSAVHEFDIVPWLLGDLYCRSELVRPRAPWVCDRPGRPASNAAAPCRRRRRLSGLPP